VSTPSPEELPGYEQWVSEGPLSEPLGDLETQVTVAASTLAASADIARMVAETAVGHRRILIEGGFDEERARQAAFHLHALLIQRWFS
jgi:hypothetical protein